MGTDENRDRSIAQHELWRMLLGTNAYVEFVDLICRAGSTSELKQLHDELPPDQQLPRAERRILVTQWQDLEEAGGLNARRGWARSMTHGFSAGPRRAQQGLWPLYVDLLDKGRRLIPEHMCKPDESRLLHAWVKPGDDECWGNWATNAFGHRFALACWDFRDTGELFVKLMIESREIDRSFYEKLSACEAVKSSLIRQPEQARRTVCSFDPSDPQPPRTYVDFFFVLERGDLPETIWRDDEGLVDAAVARKLESDLQKIGLPIEEIFAVVPWSDELCLPGTKECCQYSGYWGDRRVTGGEV